MIIIVYPTGTPAALLFRCTAYSQPRTLPPDAPSRPHCRQLLHCRCLPAPAPFLPLLPCATSYFAWRAELFASLLSVGHSTLKRPPALLQRFRGATYILLFFCSRRSQHYYILRSISTLKIDGESPVEEPLVAWKACWRSSDDDKHCSQLYLVSPACGQALSRPDSAPNITRSAW